MFTGIITHTGTVAAIEKSGDWKFTIAASGITDGLTMGASIACSGCCLTATNWDENSFTVQVSQETRIRTTLDTWEVGTRINLERALKVGDELGGHFVSGHVDGVVTLETIEKHNESSVWWLRVQRHCEEPTATKQSSPTTQHDNKLDCFASLAITTGLEKFIAVKGSVTLDGVSLTVNKVEGNRFTVNIIPHTQSHTSFANRKVGDMLNMEIDVIARYLARQKEV